jgi:hypothetical protein
MSALVVPDSDQQGALALFDDNGNFATGLTLDSPDVIQKEQLIGIPLKVVNATFQIPTKGNGMVSLECYVGSEKAIARNERRGNLGPMAKVDGELVVEPGEMIVINDGSTGIRRQLVQILQAQGRLDVGHEKMAEEGKLNESRYDLPWCEKKGDKLVPVWKSFSTSVVQGGVSVPFFTLDINLPKGFRPSEYENDSGDNVTYYLK